MGARLSLTGKVTSEYRLEGSEGASHVDSWGKSIWPERTASAKAGAWCVGATERSTVLRQSE